MTGHLSPFDQAKVAIEEANRLVDEQVEDLLDQMDELLKRVCKDRPDVHQRVIATVTPRVVAGAAVWHLIVDSCPYCGKQHSHGGGPITGDWRRLLGHRVADCGGRGGYVLLEPQRTPHGKEATP